MPKPPPPPVTVTKAIAQDVPVYLDEIGKTTASEVVTIQAQVSGQIMERHFVDGAELSVGQLLFVIDKRPFQAKVAEASANVDQARAMLELAQADYNRIQRAFKVGAATREDVDTKKGTLDSAEAQIKATQAALDTANLNLNYCTINSPVAGRAGARLVDTGNIVTANMTNLLTIQRIAPIYVDFTVTERELPDVRRHMNARTLQTRISLPQTPGEFRTGDLSFLDNSVQEGAGRIRVRATLENTDRYFWPGQLVNVRLVLETIPQAVLIPYAAVQISQQGPYVFVIKSGDIADQRHITLGQRQGDLVVVKEGVRDGETVVATGQLSVTDQAQVHVLEPAGTSASAPGTAKAPATEQSASAPSTEASASTAASRPVEEQK